MKRTRILLTSAAAAAVLVLTGCSSTNAGSPVIAGGTTGAANTQSSDSSPSQTSDSSSSSSDSSSSESSTESSDSSSSSSESSDSSTESSDSSSSSSDAGGSGGSTDPATAAWFTTYCDGLKPIVDSSKDMSKLTSGPGNDPQAYMKTAGQMFQTWGKAFSDTAGKLKGMPAPGVSGGAEFAAEVIPALDSAGKQLTDLGGKFISGDMSAAGDMTGGLTDLQTSMGALGKANPQVAAAAASVPACQKLGS